MEENNGNLNDTKSGENKRKISKIWLIILLLVAILLIIIFIRLLNNQYNKNEYEYDDKYDSEDEYKNEFLNYNKYGYPTIDKPIIYLYPEEETEISVELGNSDKLTSVYPEYNNGWTVIAYPDGTLVDKKTGREYYSLYYESENNKIYNKDIKDGFVVKNEELVKFLEEKLDILGLNDKEAEEFIIYWLPRLQQYEYVYIRFQTMEEIEENMPLILSQEPDTLIRIMMEWKGLDKYVDVKEQEITQINRTGFTVVEWGGTEIQ